MDQVKAAALVAGHTPSDREAVAQAYRVTFSGENGQLVLLDMMTVLVAGIEPGLTADERAFRAGQIALVMKIAAAAGYSKGLVAAAAMTGKLEGANHGGRERYGDGGRPILDDGEQF